MDVISNRGGFLENIKGTLIELITRNFVEISKKRRANKKNSKSAKSGNRLVNSPNSISSIIISPEIRKIKNKSEKKPRAENLEETTEESEDKPEIAANGGYGTVSRHYGMSPVDSYVKYDQVWKHIGTFRSQSMYENLMEGFFSQSENKSSGILVDNKVIEKAERHFKYFISGEVIGDVGYVPPVGVNIDSKDWEKYRMMTQMSIYRPLLALFRAIV